MSKVGPSLTYSHASGTLFLLFLGGLFCHPAVAQFQIDADAEGDWFQDEDCQGDSTAVSSIVFVPWTARSFEHDDLTSDGVAMTEWPDMPTLNMEGADLQGAELTDADYRNANLSGADLTRTKLRNVDLSNADLS